VPTIVEGIEHIVGVLRYAPSLQYLNIANNMIGKKGAMLLATLLNQSKVISISKFFIYIRNSSPDLITLKSSSHWMRDGMDYMTPV